MIKAVLFDMDGVIIDSEPFESRAWEEVLLEYGKKPLFENGLVHAVGASGEETFRQIMEKHELEEDIEVIKTKKRMYFKNIVLKEGKPMPGLIPLISLLRKNKIKTALVSNRIIEFVEIIVEKLKQQKSFEVVIGAQNSLRKKPFPDMYLYCAKMLRVSPKVCAVIEDSEIGVVSAKAAGMKVIAIPNKHTSHQDFSKADKIVKSLSEITLTMTQSL